MSTAVKRRRGTTVQHSTFIGQVAETTVDTDKKTVVVHDGVRPGGYPVQNYINALAFAKGDGVTNDRAALNLALAAGAGGEVVFPAGIYNVSDYLLVPANTRVKFLANASLRVTGDISVSVLGANHQGQVLVLNGSNISVEDAVIDCAGYVAGGCVAAGVENISVIGCRIDNGTRQGVLLTEVEKFTVLGNRLTRLQHGVQIWECDSGVIQSNFVDKIDGGGLWQASCNRIAFTGNVVSNCADVGLDVEGGENVVVSGNTVSRCNNGELTVFSDGVNPAASMKNIAFSGNTARRETEYTKIDGTAAATNAVAGAITIALLNAVDHEVISFAGNTLFADTRYLIYQNTPADVTKRVGLLFENNTGLQKGNVAFIRMLGGVGLRFSGNTFENVTAANTGTNEFKNCSDLLVSQNTFKFVSKAGGYAMLWYTDVAGITSGTFERNTVIGAGKYGFKHDPYVSGTVAVLVANDWTGGTYAEDGGVLATANGYPMLRNQTFLVHLPNTPLNTPATIAWDLLTIGGGVLKGYYITARMALCLNYGNVMRTYYEGLTGYFESTGGALASPTASIARSGGVASATFAGTTITIATTDTGYNMAALLKIEANTMVF